MDFKIAAIVISITMTVVGYWYYFRDIFAGKTKPHAYSWLVWACLTAIAFGGQISDNAGMGAWITAITAVISFTVFLLALRVGEKDITSSDKLSLAAAGSALFVWFFTNDPLLAVIMVTVIDFFGFLPTIRKSYKKPYEETLISYVMAGLKFILAIFALENYTIITWLYPASLVVINLSFALMLIVRRRQVSTAAL